MAVLAQNAQKRLELGGVVLGLVYSIRLGVCAGAHFASGNGLFQTIDGRSQEQRCNDTRG
jgi:hypothetical protein